MNKRILCIVGTRPEAIKMAPVIAELRRQGWADVTVASTGQHRELVRQLMAVFAIEIDHDLDVMQDNQTLAGVGGNILLKLDPLLVRNQYDLVLVQGDTTSVAIAALAAFYRRIPVGHVEAGLRTHDIQRPFPEEMHRVVAGVVSSIHFAPTRQACDNLLAERIPADRVHVTGNTVVDALLSISSLDLPCRFPVGRDRKLILVTAHRRENFGEPIVSICAAIRELHATFDDVEFVYPVHPNPNIHGPVHANLANLERVHLIPPADYQELVTLMKRSTLILTDSGGIQEEAPALAKPVLVLRDETERPEAIQAGVARLVGADRERIVRETVRLLTDPGEYQRMARGGSPYGDGKAARRIVDLCHAFLAREAVRSLVA